MKISRICTFIALLGLLTACEDYWQWDLEKKEFIQIEITGIQSLSVDTVQVNGEILDLVEERISRKGFIWKEGIATPNLANYDGIVDLGPLEPGNPSQMTAIIPNLNPLTTFSFKAFAQFENADTTVYSTEAIPFTTSSGEVFTLTGEYMPSNTMIWTGQLNGLDKGLIANRHGFCWSTTNTLPTLNDAFEDLGSNIDIPLFSFSFEPLQNNTPLYCRAFAEFENGAITGEVVYGEVLTFNGDLEIWKQRTSFESARKNATSFVLNGKGYVAFGLGALGSGSGYLKEVLEYNPDTGNWNPVAEFPGRARASAVAFTIDNKAYVGLGINGVNEFDDIWSYDPIINQWDSIPSPFPGGPRYGATAFTIESTGLAYIGAGIDEEEQFNNDFWSFDPTSNEWTPVQAFEGGQRAFAIGFSLDNKGYLGAGINESGEFQKDWWQYNAEMDNWIRLDPSGNSPEPPERVDAFCFTIGNKAYIGAGLGLSNVRLKDLWELDATTLKWKPKLEFSGTPRSGAIGFSVNEKGYIGAGEQNNNTLKDFWEYDPRIQE